MEQVKLISATVVLTVLVWTIADQLVSDTAEIEATVRAQPVGGGGMIVRTDPPGQDKFLLTVTGPKRLVEQLRSIGLPVLTIPVHDDLRGAYNVPMKQTLSASEDQLRGLRIDKVVPAEVRVVIDHLETVTMPLVVDGGTLEYDVPPQAEPAEVEVTLARAALEELSQRRVLLQVADIFRNRPPGVPQTVSGVPLTTKLSGVDVQIAPPTVTVRGTVRKQSKTGTIPAVPIQVQSSLENFNRFLVETRDGRPLITRAIMVQGPPKVVDSLVADRTRVTGRVVLTGSHLASAGEFVELEPVFDLPPDVHLAGAVPPVELRLVPIDDAGRQ